MEKKFSEIPIELRKRMARIKAKWTRAKFREKAEGRSVQRVAGRSKNSRSAR